VPFSFGSVAEDLNLYMFIHSMIHLGDKPSKVYVTLGLLQHLTLLPTNLMTKFSCCFLEMMQIFRPNLHNDSRPMFNSTQPFLLVQKLKSAQRAEVLGIKAEAKKKIFSICPELLIHAELYGLVLAPRL
jgi:hypothetical protein